MLPVGLPLATAPFVLFARWAAAILAFTTFDTFEFVVGEIGVAVVVSDVPSSIPGATGQVREGQVREVQAPRSKVTDVGTR